MSRIFGNISVSQNLCTPNLCAPTTNGNVTLRNNILPLASRIVNIGSKDDPFTSSYFKASTVYIGDVSLSATGTSLVTNNVISNSLTLGTGTESVTMVYATGGIEVIGQTGFVGIIGPIGPTGPQGLAGPTGAGGSTYESVTGTNSLSPSVNVSFVNGTTQSLPTGTTIGLLKTIYKVDGLADSPTGTWSDVPGASFTGGVTSIVINRNTNKLFLIAYYNGPGYLAEYNITTSTWSSIPNTPNFNTTICEFGINPFNGRLLGGAGSSPSNGIYEWDGSAWNLYATISGTRVYSIHTGEDGYLYVGGSFSDIDGIPVSNIAYKTSNTGTWNALGSGLGAPASDAVFSVYAVSTSQVYTGGLFTSNPGGNLASYNGSSWSVVGPGVNFKVNTVLYKNPNLYVGVDNTISNPYGGAISPTGIAVYNGSTLQTLDTGLGRAGGPITVSLQYNSSSNILYIGGLFSTAFGQASKSIAFYNPITNEKGPLGVGLGYTGSSNPGLVSNLDFDNTNNLYLAGGFDLINGNISTPYALAKYAVGQTPNYTTVINGPLSGPTGTAYSTVLLNTEGAFVNLVTRPNYRWGILSSDNVTFS